MKKIDLPQNQKLFAIGLILAALVLYLPVLGAGFAWDELNLYLGSSLYIPPLESAFVSPMYNVSMNFNNIIFGDNPMGFHLFNILLHAANAVLVLMLCRRVLGSPEVALMASAIFVVHPMASEAVSLVLGRVNLLMTLLSLITLVLYFSYRQNRNMAALVACALFFLLALLCGAAAVSVVLIIILYEFLDTSDRRVLMALGIAFAFAGIGYALLYLLTGPYYPQQVFMLARFIDVLSSMGYYIWTLLFPVWLQFLPQIEDSIWFMLLAPVYITIAILAWGEGYKKISVMALLVPVVLIPASMLSLMELPQTTALRYAYISIVFFAILASMAIGMIQKPKMRYSIFTVLILLLAAQTFSQSFLWRSDARVWAEPATRIPTYAAPYLNLGATFIRDGHYKEGVEALEMALNRNDISFESMQNIMTLFARTGMGSDDMILDALARKRGKAEADFGMGFMYYNIYRKDKSKKENLKKSVAFLNSAVAANPEHHRYQYYMGLSLFESMDIAGAAASFKASRELDLFGQYERDIDYFLDLIEGLSKQGVLDNPASSNTPASP